MSWPGRACGLAGHVVPRGPPGRGRDPAKPRPAAAGLQGRSGAEHDRVVVGKAGHAMRLSGDRVHPEEAEKVAACLVESIILTTTSRLFSQLDDLGPGGLAREGSGRRLMTFRDAVL